MQISLQMGELTTRLQQVSETIRTVSFSVECGQRPATWQKTFELAEERLLQIRKALDELQTPEKPLRALLWRIVQLGNEMSKTASSKALKPLHIVSTLPIEDLQLVNDASATFLESAKKADLRTCYLMTGSVRRYLRRPSEPFLQLQSQAKILQTVDDEIEARTGDLLEGKTSGRFAFQNLQSEALLYKSLLAVVQQGIEGIQAQDQIDQQYAQALINTSRKVYRRFLHFADLTSAGLRSVCEAHQQTIDYLSCDYLSNYGQAENLEQELASLFQAYQQFYHLPKMESHCSLVKFLNDKSEALCQRLHAQALKTFKKCTLVSSLSFNALIAQKALDAIPKECLLLVKGELIRHLMFHGEKEILEVLLYLLNSVEGYKPLWEQRLRQDAVLQTLASAYVPRYPLDFTKSLVHQLFCLSLAQNEELSPPFVLLYYAKSQLFLQNHPNIVLEKLGQLTFAVKQKFHLPDIIFPISSIVPETPFNWYFASFAYALYSSNVKEQMKERLLRLLSHSPPDFSRSDLQPLQLMVTQYVLMRASNDLQGLIDFEKCHLLDTLQRYLNDYQMRYDLLRLNSLLELEHLLYKMKDSLAEPLSQARDTIWLEVMRNYDLFLKNYKLLKTAHPPEYIAVVEQCEQCQKGSKTLIRACLADMKALWKTRTDRQSK